MAVISLLARFEEPLSVRAISRILDLNRSTAGAILGSLERHGWAVHQAPQGFTAGPALLALATDLRERIPVVRAAETVLRSVAIELGVTASLSHGDGDWFTALTLAGPGPFAARRPALPSRLAMRPPMGAVIVAGAEAVIVDSWLADAPDPTTRDHLERFLAAVREHGFGVFRYDEAATVIAERLAVLRRSHESLVPPVAHDEVGSLLLHLGQHGYTSEELTGARGELPVAMLAAPVLDGSGRPRYELALHVVRNATPLSTLCLYARRLLETADELTRAAGGLPPHSGARRWPFSSSG